MSPLNWCKQGGHGTTRGRTPERATVQPRAAPTDIWQSYDDDGNGNMNQVGCGSREEMAGFSGSTFAMGNASHAIGGGSSSRELSISDVGSEKGSDELRGIAYVQCSPVSSASSSWAGSTYGGSASSTPSHKRAGREAKAGSSPRPLGGSGNGVLYQAVDAAMTQRDFAGGHELSEGSLR